MLQLPGSICGSTDESRLAMKICAYCTTRNRDEAIFCSHCRRPLRGTPIPKDTSLLKLLAVLFVIGMASYLFLSTSSETPAMPKEGPASARIPEPVTLRTCVAHNTHIRRGPSTRAETIGGLLTGSCLTILGRNEGANWAYVISDDYQNGWVAARLLSDAGDINRVSVRAHIELANPARPTLASGEIINGAQAFLTRVAATSLPGGRLTRFTVPCFKTADRIGNIISCRMEKAHCDYLTTAKGQVTFCSDRPYPDHIFTLLAPGEDRSDLDGQCLIVSGYLQVEHGALQVQVLKRDQVSPCE